MPFVGRSDHLDAIASALAASVHAGARLVIVEGEAGIGKSALVDEALLRHHGDARRAKADELATSTPFATLTAALRLPGDATAEQLLDHVAGLVAAAPLALVLDDAQWLDPATLLLLDRVLEELADHPLTVLVPMRPLPHPRELAALVTRQGRRTHLVLPPMDRSELEELIATSDLDVAPAAVPLDDVGGNPLYALELASAIAGEGGAPAGLAPPLSVTILRRLSYLGPATLTVLRSAALLGAAFDLSDLVLIADGSSQDVLLAVEEATKAGVLRSEGDALRFSHDLVRSALYDDAPAAVRRFEHRRIGAALAAAGRPAPVVATHFELAAVPGDAEAVQWLHGAALAVGRRSADASVDLLRRALALEPRDAAVRERIVSDLTTQLGRTGRFDEVIETAQESLARVPSDEASVTLTISLAQALNGRGRTREACQLLEERAAGASTAQRSRLVGMLASTHLSNGDASAARQAADAAVAAATEAGDDHWLRSTWAVQSWLATGAGDPEAGIRLAEASIDPSDDDPYAAVFNRLALGAALLEADRIHPAEASFRLAVTEAEASGVEANVTLAHLGIGLCAYAAGRLDDAATAAETALTMAEAKGNRTSDLYAAGLLARVVLHRDGPAAATPFVADAQRRLEAAGPALGAELVVWSVAAHAEATGGHPDLDLVALVWQLHPLRYLLTWRMVAPDLVRWAVAADRHELARATVADVEAVAGSAGVGRLAVLARCVALVSTDPAEPEPPETPRPLESAAARVDTARAALDAGRRDRGGALLREAHAAFVATGAAADAEAVVELARRHRIRLERPVRTSAGPGEGLTAAERRVAALAATGMTNRAIGAELAMSRHTVDTHLRHVYRKLGVAGRVELARHPSVS